MAPGLSLRTSFVKLASTSSYEPLSHLTIKVPSKFVTVTKPPPPPGISDLPLCSDKVGWNSHRSFTLEQFQNLRNLYFACDMECPDPLNLAITLHNIAPIMRTAPYNRPLAIVLLKFKCDLTTIMDAK